MLNGPSLHPQSSIDSCTSNKSDKKMNSFVTLFSLAVLVGLSSSMRVVESDGDDELSPDLGGWGFSISFGDADKSAVSEDNIVATSGQLCKTSDFNVNINKKDNLTYNYEGCLDITKTGNKFSITFKLDKLKAYTNDYEMNKVDVLPCEHYHKDPREAYVCPKLYDVDLKKGKFCAKLVETFHIHDTNVNHEVELGCTTIV